MSLAAFLALGFASIVGSEKIGDMDQGAEFTKCISKTDLETKTLDDDITLIDRVGDCCPAGSVPGVRVVACSVMPCPHHSKIDRAISISICADAC